MWNSQDYVVSRSSFGGTVVGQRVERMNISKAGQVQITKGYNCWGKTSWCWLYSKKLWRSAQDSRLGTALLRVKFWKSEFGMGWLGGKETYSEASAAMSCVLEFFATDIWQKHILLDSLGISPGECCSFFLLWPSKPLDRPMIQLYLVGNCAPQTVMILSKY